LQIDYPQAHAAIQTTGERLIGESWNQALFTSNRPPLEITCLFPQRRQLEDLQQLLQDNAPQLWAPDLGTLEPEAFQLFHLLVLLLTRRLHLGEVLLFVLDEAGGHRRPAPRWELAGPVRWLDVVKVQHQVVRETLRWVLALRKSDALTRRVPARRLPVHLGWTEDEQRLEELLTARRPLYLHQIFEILFFLGVPIRDFVRYLYFIEATELGTSRAPLRILEQVAQSGQPAQPAQPAQRAAV